MEITFDSIIGILGLLLGGGAGGFFTWRWQRNQMKRDIARNGRQLECLRPFLCGREDCALRVPVTISQVGEIEKTLRPQSKKNDIDPYNGD